MFKYAFSKNQVLKATSFENSGIKGWRIESEKGPTCNQYWKGIGSAQILEFVVYIR